MGATPAVSDETFLQTIEEQTESQPITTTLQIAEAVLLTRDGAYKRLRRLHREGDVEIMRAGNSIGWYLSEDGEQ